MKKILSTTLLLLFALSVMAQMMDPVHFTSKLNELKGGEAELVFSATIDPGWHVYSTNLGNDGPISASFNAVKMDGVEPIGKLQTRGKEIKQYDKLFEMELRYFERAVTFVQKIRFTKPQYDIDCYIEYGACNDQACLPPSEAPLKVQGKSPVVEDKAEKTPEPEAPVVPATPVIKDSVASDSVATDSVSTAATDLWQPVIEELRAMGSDSENIADHSLLYILLMGFVGGLLAGAYGVDLINTKAVQKGLRYITAGAMIARDKIMADSEKVQAAASDIIADAKEITERYYAESDKASEDFEEVVG